MVDESCKRCSGGTCLIWWLRQKCEDGRRDPYDRIERDVSTALLYTWRRELRYAVEASKIPLRHEPMFVPVVGETSSPGSHDAVVEAEVSGAVVRIRQTARTDLVVAIIEALHAPGIEGDR